MEVDIPTEEEIRSLGWNTVEHDDPTLFARITAEQLRQQNSLLLAIFKQLQKMAEK